MQDRVDLEKKDAEKLIDAFQHVVNIMNDLTKLSIQHNIKNDLYHGDVLERIFKQLGDRWLTSWISDTCDNLSKEDSWKSVIQFLEKEVNIMQQKRMFIGREDYKEIPNDRVVKKAFIQHTGDNLSNPDYIFPICGEAGHVDSMGPITQE